MTPGPTASAVPAPSEPGTTGSMVGKVYRPCTTGEINPNPRSGGDKEKGRNMHRGKESKEDKEGSYPWDNQVSVVERRRVEVDEDIALAKTRYWGLGTERQAIETVLSFDRPLFGACGCHLLTG